MKGRPSESRSHRLYGLSTLKTAVNTYLRFGQRIFLPDAGKFSPGIFCGPALWLFTALYCTYYAYCAICRLRYLFLFALFPVPAAALPTFFRESLNETARPVCFLLTGLAVMCRVFSWLAILPVKHRPVRVQRVLLRRFHP